MGSNMTNGRLQCFSLPMHVRACGADLFQVDNALSLIKIGGFDGITNNAAESSTLHDLIYLSTYPGAAISGSNVTVGQIS